MRPTLSLLALSLGMAVVPLALADDTAPGRRADQAALKAYGALVGQWRGTGQPQRLSRKGAWTESAEWAWKLSKDSAALDLTIAKGKYLKSGRLVARGKAGGFALDAVLADDTKRTFVGEAGSMDRLALTAEGPATDGLRRVTITPLHDTRFLLLLESQDPDTDQFARIAEVGYTRQGVAFAGESYPTCIVTEGRGTIPVQYKGTTYYVCCTGCKELFDADPAAAIAEAEAKKKARAQK
jgi:YHS domain-containing protein